MSKFLLTFEAEPFDFMRTHEQTAVETRQCSAARCRAQRRSRRHASSTPLAANSKAKRGKNLRLKKSPRRKRRFSKKAEAVVASRARAGSLRWRGRGKRWPPGCV